METKKTSIKEKILSELNKKKQEIYSFKEILNISGSRNKNAIRVIIFRIIKEKRLIPLKAGIYLYVPEGYQKSWTTNNFWIGANLVKPYAISFWSALNHWGLTEQLPNKTYIQTTKSLKNYNKKILNNDYQFVKLANKRFFGIAKIWVANHQVNITDQEKTLVDCLIYPQYGGGIIEAVKGLYQFYQNSQPKNIISYARKMGQPALKRLGFLLELLEVSNQKELNKIKKLITNPNYILLEPLIKDKNAAGDSKWKIKVNVAKKDLLKWKTK
jgi:predicted transcriptional regulator of viral defense system